MINNQELVSIQLKGIYEFLYSSDNDIILIGLIMIQSTGIIKRMNKDECIKLDKYIRNKPHSYLKISYLINKLSMKINNRLQKIEKTSRINYAYKW